MDWLTKTHPLSSAFDKDELERPAETFRAKAMLYHPELGWCDWAVDGLLI